MGVHIPYSKGHTEVWESMSLTQGAIANHGTSYPQLEGPHRSVGVHIPNSRPNQSMGAHIPNSRRYAEGWESISHFEEPY